VKTAFRVLKNQQGFSFVEVLGALVLLLLVALFSTSVSVQTKNNFWYEQRRNVAMNVAESLVEELILRAKADAELTPGTHEREYDRNGLPATGAAGSQFKAAWVVTYDRPRTDMFEVKVRVSWNERATPRAVELLTARSFIP
jgi:Tfp pilus assembly protein PilV